ncbi:hypothetical protein CA236_15725 [Sphingomonas sp. ABOLG]|nr:hypothetical protein CA236_15725 [Sphingomonas sp. ABOLG]
MPDSRRCLFIQADTLLVVESDVVQGGATPAHTDIDMPLAAVMLADVDVSERAPWGSHRCQFPF